MKYITRGGFWLWRKGKVKRSKQADLEFISRREKDEQRRIRDLGLKLEKMKEEDPLFYEILMSRENNGKAIQRVRDAVDAHFPGVNLKEIIKYKEKGDERWESGTQ